MRQTTHAKKGGRAPTHADPYAYDLPLTHHGRPVSEPRPAPPDSQQTWLPNAVLSAVAVLMPLFMEESRRPLFVYLCVAAYGVAMVLSYWQGARPKQSFLSWTLKVVGICLNFYVAFVTVPLSLRGVVPEWLAFGLPAFVATLVWYWVRPLRPSDKTYTLWHWLLYSAWSAAGWAWAGPFFLKG